MEKRVYTSKASNVEKKRSVKKKKGGGMGWKCHIVLKRIDCTTPGTNRIYSSKNIIVIIGKQVFIVEA